MSGYVFIFGGSNGIQVKLFWPTSDGRCLPTRRLERDRFTLPSAQYGKVFITPELLAMFLEGIKL
ncbi:IS66 family insertion sequence element accessory protein TnpB [Escherichia coli]